jgi:hypothetical protein
VKTSPCAANICVDKTNSAIILATIVILSSIVRVQCTKGAVVTNNRTLADILTISAYFSLAVAALVFVSMLLLTGLHP